MNEKKKISKIPLKNDITIFRRQGEWEMISDR